MTYQEAVKKFLEKVLAIFNSNPKRREPGDGSDGYCDCIGLIIGAIRRMGLKWTGIHGSNWAARKEVRELKPISSQSELQPGDIVFKAVAQGKSSWALPSRYRKGGQYYNGDLNDYYHAGVVYSVNPFQIRHMSSKMTIDTKVNTYYPWTHFAKSRQLIEASQGYSPTPTPSSGTEAVVVAKSGSTVNLRRSPSKNSAILTRVKLGNRVTLVAPGEEWASVSYGKYTGYMMSQFLDVVGDGKGKY